MQVFSAPRRCYNFDNLEWLGLASAFASTGTSTESEKIDMRNMRNDIKRFTVAVLAACGLAVSAALAEPSYQAKLTVQGYEGAELADFPVLVRLSPQTVAGFHYGTCKADGSDIVFEIGRASCRERV